MQDALKSVWSIPYVSMAFLPSSKQNFIAYRSSKLSSRPDFIFEIHQLWQSGFRRVYSNCRCSCSFEAEIIKIGQSSHKMYSNNMVNFQESMTILNACTKKSGNLLKPPHISHVSSSNSHTWLLAGSVFTAVYPDSNVLTISTLPGPVFSRIFTTFRPAVNSLSNPSRPLLPPGFGKRNISVSGDSTPALII